MLIGVVKIISLKSLRIEVWCIWFIFFRVLILNFFSCCLKCVMLFLEL